MDEKEILQRIKEDSRQIEVPEELQPAQIEKMLESIQQMQADWKENKDADGQKAEAKRKTGKRRISRYSRQIAAAAVVLVGVCTLYAGSRVIGISDSSDTLKESNSYEVATDTDYAVESVDGEETESVAKLGDMYTRAENYEEIYDEIKTLIEKRKKENADITYGVWDMIAEVEDVEDNAASAESSGNGAAESGTDYSKTNVMTAGVDESDIVKTDGSYLYMVENNSISITDLRNGGMKEVSVIRPPKNTSSNRILELYVDGTELVVIVEQEEVKLQQSQTNYVGRLTQELQKLISEEITYEMETDTITVAYSYDISDPASPDLIGSTRQDGAYHTSRKVGEILYLFTDDTLTLPSGSKKSALKDENLTDWIPSVNDEAISVDDIYLPQEGQNSLIISSVNVTKPKEILDTKMIVSDYVDIYVSNSSVFLYSTDWSNRHTYTQIAKFSMKEGAIQAVNAAVVMGGVRDAFAINEYQGYLRVLTSNQGGATETNAVYVLDSDMRLVGELTGIAPGEIIYSARFMGGTGYFVTYRNTDPLFSVDFTDPEKPTLMGELKITGFSEYLHFWGEDKLIGIGYETDPDTGEQLGIKLSMFDISDPSNVTEVGKRVLWGADYSPALYDYKCVLADADKNLIGFAVSNYNSAQAFATYQVYSYDNGQFVENLSAASEGEYSNYVSAQQIQNWRGLYVGNNFYLTDSTALVSYDMADGWRRLDTEWERLE